ncbi:hypothetical protein [Mycobacterium sp. OTB74]|uniref:hypothetical protein n=1 Tax=Mycobacterium sp. OTB74 TaxID=1853452 RepID=UPI002473CB33|nr:hypothetical protein [Mycobacterium sp. OTB74]MDH6247027.1 hypothetical protein [Mycobacterium sp. OTB74]
MTLNTRRCPGEFLSFAGRHQVPVTAPRYPWDHARHAPSVLAAGRICGAAVVEVS